ncbi:ubiquitin-specific protease ubp15 [Dimargaris cristalligena]|nr:ubiquitin-specific protease ubp15 [Dimargaris cristalligena]
MTPQPPPLDVPAGDDMDQSSVPAPEPAENPESHPPQGIHNLEVLKQALPVLEYDVISSGAYHWPIPKFSQLARRAHSPIFELGGQQWRMLVFPEGNGAPECISMYLECVHEKDEPEWVVCAQFVVAMSNSEDPSHFYTNNAYHRFNPQETDWGFTRFMDYRLAIEPSGPSRRPVLENDSCVLTVFIEIVRDPTGVLWHNFNNYDSKKETGHVGLHNQGATCYMNSLLQSLYFTNYFRKATYQIPTEDENPTKSVALAMQRVFYNLQFSKTTVETTELTRSFGWDSLDSFMQHDVQEFNRVLQDNLENKMKNTAAEGAISNLFVGRMKSYIKCVNVDYESSRTENYYDIQLNVKGCRTLYDSFKDYIAEEMLEGDNKYMAEGFGLQDAKKGVIFEKFPPVLHLQLKRFEYDMMRDSMVKINDRHEFPYQIDLVDFLSPEADHVGSTLYHLHGVLVHSGDLSGGHYFALIKPEKDGRWFKFDDDRVVPVTDREVMEDNYGGEAIIPVRPISGLSGRNPPAPAPPAARNVARAPSRYTNAYMLVYIQDSAIDKILAPVTAEDIPKHLKRRIEHENRAQEIQKREQLELQMSIDTKLVTDAIVKAHDGFDLVSFLDNWDTKDAEAPLCPISMRVPRTTSTTSYKAMIAERLNLDIDSFRMWLMISRQNKTIRPDFMIQEAPNVDLQYVKDHKSPKGANLRFYIEQRESSGLGPEEPFGALDHDHFLLHLKYYDPTTAKLTGLGPIYVPQNGLISDIVPDLIARAGLAEGTPLALYEEIKPGLIDRMDFNRTFVSSEMQNGDIICFQKTPASVGVSGPMGTVIGYFENYANNVRVKFEPYDPAESDVSDYDSIRTSPPPSSAAVDVHLGSTTHLPNGEADSKAQWPTVVLRLQKRLPYDSVAESLAERIGCDPRKIRLITPNAASDVRGLVRGPQGMLNVVKRTPNMTLSEMTRTWDYVPTPTQGVSLLYEVLPVTLEELESQRAYSVNWIQGGNIRNLVTFDVVVAQTATVGELEAKILTKYIEHFHIQSPTSVPAAGSPAVVPPPTQSFGHIRVYDSVAHMVNKVFSSHDPVSNLVEENMLYAEFMTEDEELAIRAQESAGVSEQLDSASASGVSGDEDGATGSIEEDVDEEAGEEMEEVVDSAVSQVPFVLVPVSLFDRELNRCHGTPFFLLVRAGESTDKTKARLQRRLGAGDKEFHKMKLVAMLPVQFRSMAAATAGLLESHYSPTWVDDPAEEKGEAGEADAMVDRPEFSDYVLDYHHMIVSTSGAAAHSSTDQKYYSQVALRVECVSKSYRTYRGSERSIKIFN